MTKANQVAPLLATLRGLIPDATEAIDELAKLAKYVDEVEARAEQAEYSLAASERALAALRYQAQAGGCELSTVGENFYHCRADALCGLCRLRHRAEQAERDRDAWREKWEALETTRAVCCAQIERERDEARATNRDNLAMWEVERDALKAKLAEAERENLTLRNRIGIDRTSWHEAEAEVKVLRAKLAKTERERDDAMTLAEERRDYARAQNAKLSVECDDLRAQLTAVERERDEARAEVERRKEELRLAQCPNPRDPEHGGHCETCSGLSVARTRQLHEQESRIAELEAKLADCESYHLECGDCGKMQTFIGKGLFECYSCAWREASEEVRALQAKLAEAETFRREWGEAHNRLTTLTDELLGPAPTMPLLALIERLERADPRTGTTRREPPETAIGWSTGAVIPRDPCAHLCRYCGGGLQHHGLCLELDPQSPATRAELEELRREILTTLSDALERIHIPVPGSSGWAEVPLGLRELAEELRRRIERLETKE